jgi:phospholipid/cholesterol/gamma-HCH transport system ATP-binding protein
VTHYLTAVGLPHARDLYPDEISGGMQKRLGIARALALKPQIIFYDDPTAGLDPITSRKIVDLILSLSREQKSTAVAVTNDMNRAYQMASRIGMVIDSELIVMGTPEQTKKHADPRVRHFITGGAEA